jgi:glycosyltransferase involved in cell wall biosynthesis
MWGKNVVCMHASEESAQFDDNSSVQPVLSVVVIGRNEGQRLARCFESIARIKRVDVKEVIYVDSASTDCSAELASRYGAFSITIHPERPTAAVARNTGWRRAASDLILFLDGDTVLRPDFPRNAYDALSMDESIAAVWGHRREMHPERSIFNRVLDLDWIYRPGLTDFCGGDVLMRRIALVETGGFDDGLIAGEEPELCRRMRARGFKILHIDEPMTGHDLAIRHWGQYWKRALRAGHAYAEVSERFRNSNDSFWSSEQKANILRGSFWALSFTAASITIVRFGFVPFACWLGLLLLLSSRSGWRARWKSESLLTLLLYGIHSQVQQVPIFIGQLTYAFEKSRSNRSRLIEYKTN